MYTTPLPEPVRVRTATEVQPAKTGSALLTTASLLMGQDRVVIPVHPLKAPEPTDTRSLTVRAENPVHPANAWTPTEVTLEPRSMAEILVHPLNA